MATLHHDIVIESDVFRDGWQEQEKRSLERWADAFRRADDGDLVGKTLRYQVADGYATYMVVKQKGGIGIASVQMGDGYRYDEDLLQLADEAYIRKQIEREEAINALFEKKAAS